MRIYNNKICVFSLVLVVSLTLAFVCGCNESQGTIGTSNSIIKNSLRDKGIEITRQGLADSDPMVRVRAIEVAAASKNKKLMYTVATMLDDKYIRTRFVAALAVGDVEFRPAQKKLQRMLKDQNENARMAVAYALYKLGGKGYYEIVERSLSNKDQTIRANAAMLLGKMKNQNATRPLYWALKDNNSGDNVRFQVLESLAMLQDKGAYKKIWTMLISAYVQDKIMGIRAMGAMGNEDAKNALLTVLDDDILEVRLAAAAQLGQLYDTTGEPFVQEVFFNNLRAGMNDYELERVNVLTALAIGQIGTESVMRYLPEFLNDKSKFVRLAAAKAVFDYENLHKSAL